MSATSWVVTPQLHESFAHLSGDYNPIHTDPIAARRFPFGRPVVHGMHTVLDALDRLAEQTDRRLLAVSAIFRHPVSIGEMLTVELDPIDEDTQRCRVMVDVWIAVDLVVTLGPASTPPDSPAPRDGTKQLARFSAEPLNLGFDELADREGSIPIAINPAQAVERFPRLVNRIGLDTVAELCAITRLVGMNLPGARSLFSSFDVEFGARRDAANALVYRVSDVDERFARVMLDVAGPTICGSVVTFVREEPTTLPTQTHDVVAGEFRHVKALVIGGSRGLGAAGVQMLHAGGADVRFTYRTGQAEAEQLAGPGVAPFRYEVGGDRSQLALVLADGWAPTHLLYFATPPIFEGVRGIYSDSLAAEFRSIYIDGFTALVELLVEDGLHHGLEAALWPSSVAVETEPAGMAEYAQVKRDGEDVCRELAERHDIRISTPRFARLRTDQTATIMPIDGNEPAGPVLDALRVIAG
jgi:hypothetical protein